MLNIVELNWNNLKKGMQQYGTTSSYLFRECYCIQKNGKIEICLDFFYWQQNEYHFATISQLVTPKDFLKNQNKHLNDLFKNKRFFDGFKKSFQN